jgi:hypothetical protein
VQPFFARVECHVMARKLSYEPATKTTKRGVPSGTLVVLGMFLGGIGLGLTALKYRRFQPLPGRMTTQPTTQPDTWPASAPGENAADLPEQR